MHPSVRGVFLSVLVGAAAGAMGGCASDRELSRLTATLEPAAVCGNAHHLARCIRDDLGSRPAISDSDKAALRARAAVLQSHAEKLSAAIDRFDPAGRVNPSITLENLRARAGALETEYDAAFREWGIWQVQHGLRKPDEVFEVFREDRLSKVD